MFKEIPGYSRYKINESGVVRNKYRELKQQTSTKGYKTICLIGDDGKKKAVKIHRLVGLTYIENPENKPQINHKDGDKLNNHVSNLEWCTNQENMDHAHKNGLREGIHPTGVDNHSTDLKVYEWIHQITKERERLISIELCKKYKLEVPPIRSVARGDSRSYKGWMLEKEYKKGGWEKNRKNIQRKWVNKYTGEREECSAAELARRHNLPQPNAGKQLGRKSYKGWIREE